MSDTLTPKQIQQIIDATHDHVKKAAAAYKKALPLIDVQFNVSGHTWGYYRRRGNEKVIRYNPQLFSLYFEEGINDTVPHEVAHYVVDELSPRRCKPHGKEWRRVMGLFGISNPRATHKTDVSRIPSRRQRTHPYRCNCRNHALSTTRHNKILRKQMDYFCRNCGGKLTYQKQD